MLRNIDAISKIDVIFEKSILNQDAIRIYKGIVESYLN